MVIKHPYVSKSIEQKTLDALERIEKLLERLDALERIEKLLERLVELQAPVVKPPFEDPANKDNATSQGKPQGGRQKGR